MQFVIERLRRQVPNLLTLTHLFLGMMAILSVCANHGQQAIYPASLFIVLAMVCDGLDGVLARRWHVVSAFGRQIDILADLLTFGVAPSVSVFRICLYELGSVGILFAALLALATAMRLARLNNLNEEPGDFIGLPVPVPALLIVSLLEIAQLTGLDTIAYQTVLILLIIVLAVLMHTRFIYPRPNMAHLLSRWNRIWPVAILSFFVLICFPHAFISVLFFPVFIYLLLGFRKLRNS
ncbi:MAG: CDP-diacylglycerol--serine O-phosphatidyltransferase [Alicyclobacillaceae bacterium]|nr:CDP-diacylglycerol--serine O-phosphatidyltransferase [Alicyclobacillaceae bacterium]